MGIAGGVNLILRPESTVMLSKAGFLNPDGYCRAFDASANGYVRAEGAGVIVIKDLRQAIADGNRVYGIIRGRPSIRTVTSQMASPYRRSNAQIEALRSAYKAAGIDPASVQYIEAHGPGTAVGDPIECEALGTVVGKARSDGRCLVGSVKTNLGHSKVRQESADF